MPYEYDTVQRLFLAPDGSYISRDELRALIDKLTDFVGKEAGRIAARFDAGAINAAQFNVEMRELLKAGHIIAASVGRGGRVRMTAADWGRVGRKIRWQYDYLDAFTAKLARGTLKLANTAYRAKQYVNSIYISYTTTFRIAQLEQPEITDGRVMARLIQNSKEGCVECTADAAEGWMPVEEMKYLGDRICGDFCKCNIEFQNEP